ncbi:tRNA modification GTPase trme [Heliomicrobium modesticaldum Ice1]|uniref:tRNA modification GTPase MnmE n=1 Tax=Heliobacterium modesticaldum (strain ATCC 51547 / Ice1) TaxID=498761 RepID=MNME_HELMI|nr:tRNA uridine-5-carboxymethylaminomethyl(34) synthesis GTPase MnmE [Heliomicrobium modesticaldum]B0TAB6.1 RecName: Full=tRNA modification GTPase MnmE [Heliomicrobium modesticaldum Ice1]ABZ83653.1 tRNA modification GTPase trme [Heliomicrobium modesticaldum Ice1]
MVGDTIAAVATPPGEGGIGIVRVSGPGARDVLKAVFRPRYGRGVDDWASHTLHLGTIIHPDDHRVIDEALVAWMVAPRTFTTEDVVEFHCHGGSVPVRETLGAVLRAGARLAEPGEFTRRAFLGGRLDLAQAEAIIEVIRAKTRDGLGAAVSQLEGQLSRRIRKVRDDLLALLAHLEAMIDFPEEDLPDIGSERICTDLMQIQRQIGDMLERSRTGRVLREGWRTVIVGRPNVGKSSLMNALLDEQRAIVTEIPGTTRDAIEEYIDLGGIPLRIVDTAGIRETEDVVERIGVEKTREYLEKADLALVVLDGSDSLTAEDETLLLSLAGRPAVVLVNKSDLAVRRLDEKRLRSLVGEMPIISVSAKEGWGLKELTELIRRMVYGDDGLGYAPDGGRLALVTQARHREALERSYAHLRQALDAVAHGASPDFLTIDLKAAWEALGEITGDTVGEDILDKIFSSFCIGK